MPSRQTGSTSLLEASPPQARQHTLPGFAVVIRSEPASVEAARLVTQAWSRCCRVPDELIADLLLVMSELCTNAVQPGRHQSIVVRGWMSTPSELCFEVDDKTPSVVPHPQRPTADRECGRGLLLVDALVADLGGTWGFNQGGTCAWCRVALPEGDR
ncbi:ATP-binding protein [Streptomyces sp. NPDC005784]|uniref:ATP-binding protein n=1 Tax=Streptomyces sp. NPDC005784 TaxID=3364731 RepID=UPI0036B5B1C1